MNFTVEQHEAIFTHDRNLIVTAGAGSGKTRVLVERFMALLDTHQDWPLPSIVAITFTEKAAREMRDRVRQAIEKRIEDAPDDISLRRWRDHQAALDSARIGTIHSLCTAILRANAAEVRIDPAFEVLDEADAAILRSEAIEQAVSNLVEDHAEAARLLTEYDVETVKKVMRERLSENQLPEAEDYLRKWQAEFELTLAGTLEALRQDQGFIDALCWQPEHGWPSGDKLAQGWQVVLEQRDYLLAAGGSPLDKLNILKSWPDQIDLRGGSAKAWGSKDILDSAKVRLRFLRDQATLIVEQCGEFGALDQIAADLLPLWAEAIQAAQDAYQELKGSRQLDFNDLEVMTWQLLQDASVASRYQGTEFKHVLVDEFQDTNSRQWDIIRALADVERPGSLFLVGDPRQSIYQFRGADVRVFNGVREAFKQVGGKEVLLNTSFRTHRRLAEAFNTIFSQLMVPGSGPNKDYYVPLEQPMKTVRELAGAPCLEMILIDKDKASEGNHGAEDLRRWEARILAERLWALKENGLSIWDKQKNVHRPIEFGDMAILFQSSKSMLLVEEVFKPADIPYVTVGGKGYFSRPEVWDLLNLLKALYNPSDSLSLASALRSPLYSLSDDDLFALRSQRYPVNAATGRAGRLSLWDALVQEVRTYDPALPDPQQVIFARESLRRLRGIAGRVPISELLVRVLEETAYLATLSGLPDGPRRCGNVEKLIELARHSGRVALGEFTLYLDDLTDREIREGEAVVATQGAVQLMTIHASKGLEFPLVALFDTSWDGGTHETTVVLDPVIGAACTVRNGEGEKVEPFAYRLAKRYAEEREDAERIRLLYVAMTRAQDYVIVSGRTNGKGWWLRELIKTLGVPGSIDEGEEELIHLGWGDCLLRIPSRQPSPDEPIARPQPTEKRDREPSITAWDDLGSQAVPGVEPYQPPLLAVPPYDRHAPARMLAATEIGVLGEAKATGRLAKFRNHILRDAPTSVRDIAGADTGLKVSPRIIGEMVHQALRWWHLPGNTPNLRRVLDSYAWEQGITDPQMIEHAIKVATDLLERTERSNLITQIQQASQVYRELPFTFQLGGRTINGIIDVLFFSKYQRWNVVDFKTSAVPVEAGEDRHARIREHAERYHAQVGIFAAAVEAMTGQTPDTYVHYIRYVYTVQVETPIWQAALNALDGDISAALDE